MGVRMGDGRRVAAGRGQSEIGVGWAAGQSGSWDVGVGWVCGAGRGELQLRRDPEQTVGRVNPFGSLMTMVSGVGWCVWGVGRARCSGAGGDGGGPVMLVGVLIGWVVGVVFAVLFFQLVAAAQADRLSERLFGELEWGVGESEGAGLGGGGESDEGGGRKVGCCWGLGDSRCSCESIWPSRNMGSEAITERCSRFAEKLRRFDLDSALTLRREFDG